MARQQQDSARWAGKAVMVTGGSSGVGLATARMLVAGGARVLITGRDPARLEAARASLGPHALAVRSDAGDPTDAAALAERVGALLGRLDGVVLNAGATRFVAFEAMTEGTFDELLAINARGPYFTLQRLTSLLAPGAGVVLTTSVANARGLPMVSAYAASKAALRSVVRSAAAELVGRGVRVNAVSPGPIDTGILERALDPDTARATREQMEGSNPMGRFGRPEEVAAAIAFLLFDATFTTGAELVVDGGGSQL